MKEKLHNITSDYLKDISKFEELFQVHYAALCSYALRFLKNHELAEDIVSETFYILWKSRDNLHKIKNPKAYLFKSVHNNCLYYIRSEKNHQTVRDYDFKILDFEKPENKDPIDSLLLKELTDQLESAISHLPDQQQKVFRMKRFENMKNKEIAKELNLSVKTVEMHMNKAVNHLWEELKYILPTFIILLLLKL